MFNLLFENLVVDDHDIAHKVDTRCGIARTLCGLNLTDVHFDRVEHAKMGEEFNYCKQCLNMEAIHKHEKIKRQITRGLIIAAVLCAIVLHGIIVFALLELLE